MKPCINQVTTLSTPFETDLRAYARAGCFAVELWLTKLEMYLESHALDEVRAQLEKRQVKAVGASSQGGLLLSRGSEREAHWSQFRNRLTILNALDVPTLVVAADFVHEPSVEELRRAMGALVEAADEAARYNVRLALEFQKASRFCASLDTALALIAQSGVENVGVCLDLFHYYTGPSKFEDLAYLSPSNLAWVQLSDLSGTPRELASDSDRILPGDGDFQIGPILDHLGQVGYDGYVSLEVFNPQLWEIPADRVADLGFQALCRSLGRWNTDETAGPWGGE